MTSDTAEIRWEERGQGELRARAALVTDMGRERERNEDCCGRYEPRPGSEFEPLGSLYIVADGMGGHVAGDVASEFAVEQVIYAYYHAAPGTPAERLVAAIRAANSGIFEESQRNPLHREMGTTVVAAALLGRNLALANVGDSRAYLIRGDEIAQISEEHSWVGERLRDGLLTPEQAQDHPNKNVLTRSLGDSPHVEVYRREMLLRAGDCLVMCTDGLSNEVSEGEMLAEVREAPNLMEAARSLVEKANERGGRDNITVALVRMHEPNGRNEDTAGETGVRTRIIARPSRRDRRTLVLVLLLTALAVLGLVGVCMESSSWLG